MDFAHIAEVSVRIVVDDDVSGHIAAAVALVNCTDVLVSYPETNIEIFMNLSENHSFNLEKITSYFHLFDFLYKIVQVFVCKLEYQFTYVILLCKLYLLKWQSSII